MARDCIISQRLLQVQEDIFRVVCDPLRYGETLKSISAKSGIPYGTLRSYAGHSGETHEMPVSAQYKLVGIIPDELLSLLLPGGRVIVKAPEHLDHDELAECFHDYLQTKERAHHPDSPAGRDIAPCEDNVLRGKFAKVKAA
jgi:hypothetical protein